MGLVVKRIFMEYPLIGKTKAVVSDLLEATLIAKSCFWHNFPALTIVKLDCAKLIRSFNFSTDRLMVMPLEIDRQKSLAVCAIRRY